MPVVTPPAPETVQGRPVEVEDRGETPGGRTGGGGFREVAATVLDRPEYAPELLALAAVEVLGPRAGTWADGLRARYPEADAAGLARLAVRRFGRRAGVGGAAATATGLIAPVVESAAVLWAQAELVLHLAAAYGRDPGHPDRAVELLVSTGIHPDPVAARTALEAAAEATGEESGVSGTGVVAWSPVVASVWRLVEPLVGGGRLPVRLAARLLPGASALAAAAGGYAATDRVAARALAQYRPAGQSQSNHSRGSRA
ncbi:hypothetical protein [Micromonospora sp. SH-82]|uniref:hypothetical protein n=1 Tax=Micromonospora sp. SH-82 TaxID=3132938 RepID=UPI003EBA23A4